MSTSYTKEIVDLAAPADSIRFRFHLDPYARNTLFLFCGKRTDRIKGLLWKGDGFLLLYKRLDTGAFNWPRIFSLQPTTLFFSADSSSVP